MSLIAKSTSIYQIGIGGDTQMRIPQFCTCCLEPTQESERIHFVNTKRGLVTRDKTYTFLNLPLCPACRQHRREQQTSKYLSLAISCLIGFGLFISLGQQVNIWLRLWLFATLALAVFLLADKYWTLSKLGTFHATRGVSVAFGHVDTKYNIAILNFASKGYAKLLCDANNWTYSPAFTKSELRKYLLIILGVCFIVGLLFQDLHF